MTNYNEVEDFLEHHGILGQKWGIRRYQNPDGSLTAAGKKRYGSGGGNPMYSMASKIKRHAEYKPENFYKSAKGLKADASVSEKAAYVLDSANNFVGGVRGIAKSRAHKYEDSIERLDLSGFSDGELQARLNRMKLEEEYDKAFNAARLENGRQKTVDFMNTYGEYLQTAGVVLSLALTAKQLLKN